MRRSMIATYPAPRSGANVPHGSDGQQNWLGAQTEPPLSRGAQQLLTQSFGCVQVSAQTEPPLPMPTQNPISSRKLQHWPLCTQGCPVSTQSSQKLSGAQAQPPPSVGAQQVLLHS